MSKSHTACTHAHTDHDTPPSAASVVRAAGESCARTGARLTPMRAQVLSLLAGSARPLGAYELIEMIGDKTHKRPAPITVYRALDFLIENGFVHRIESRNAFTACLHGHDEGDVVVFLLCACCGAVTEADGGNVAKTLKTLARAADFRPSAQVIEIEGTCAMCSSETHS